MIDLAYLDSVVSPCADFQQYATGGWYRPRTDSSMVILGPGGRIAHGLRHLLAEAPALAPTTSDIATRVLGTFYGSCLADASGVAEGAVGDTARARYCLHETRRYLSPAVTQLFLTRVWTAPARTESRKFWENLKSAAVARIRASRALQDSTKQRLLTRAAAMKLSLGFPAPLPALLDSLTAFRLPAVYTTLTLTPADFARNLAQLKAVTDTTDTSFQRKTADVVFDLLLIKENGNDDAPGYSWQEQQAEIAPRAFIPPRVNGEIDFGGWYGMVGSLLGHEMGHGFERLLDVDSLSQPERVGFMRELFRDQLEELPPSHPFDDHFGVLIAYDALQMALQSRPHRRLEGLTPDQRFFIGVAQGIMGGPPSPSVMIIGARFWVRTNGALAVMPAFARAFGCKAGGPMTGKRVWYDDPRPAEPFLSRPGQPTLREWQQAMDARHAQTFDWTARRLLWSLPGDAPSSDQGEQWNKIGERYKAAREALSDSLGIVPPGTTPSDERRRRLAESFARQLGELRAILTPAQRPVFDRLAREWKERNTEPSWHVQVPGMTP